MEPSRTTPHPMPNLSIKNVPESVVEKLRRRAEGNHRSLQGELLTLVCRAVERSDYPSRDSASDSTSPGWMSVEDVHEAWRGVPADTAPAAIDIVRKDRDRR